MTGVKHGVEITMLPTFLIGLWSGLLLVGDRRTLARPLCLSGPAAVRRRARRRACTIEIELCGKRIGKQDHYIAALGGIRDLRFGPGPDVLAEEIELPPITRGRPVTDHALLHRGDEERRHDPQ